jgi:heme oxygenase
MELKSQTKDLHHAAERHPIGQSMANGTITKRWWADWIVALKVIHQVIDQHNPESMHRVQQLEKDLEEVDVLLPTDNFAAIEYAKTLTTPEEIAGATYVFTGAHLMGGAVTAKQLNGRLPSNHLVWEDRKQTMTDWSPLRDRADLVEPAQRAFQAVIYILDEIYVNFPQG